MNLKTTIPAALTALALTLTGCGSAGIEGQSPTAISPPTLSSAPQPPNQLPTPTEPAYTDDERAYLDVQGYDVDAGVQDDVAEGLDDGDFTCDNLTEEVSEYGEASTIQRLVEGGSTSIRRIELPAAQYLCKEHLPMVKKALEQSTS